MSDQFVGEVRCVGFNFPPKGWAFCDGQLMPISQNTALFSLLGTFYGGDGRSTFALPNLQGNVAIGQGNGAGLSQMLAYLGVTILACVGYGAVFLLIGLFFRNPIIPALLLYGWEFINFLLPPLLKKLSVIHYLQSLVPVPMSEGPFAVLVEPTSAWIAVPSLFLFTGVVIFLASRHICRLEISYAGD